MRHFFSNPIFFFSSRERHTRFSRDWSSDVCSSDLKVMNWQFIVNQQVQEYKLDSSILVNDSESFLSAALHGLGLIQGVRHAIQPYLENGQLIEVLSTYQNIPKPISLLYTHREHLPARMQVFIDWVKNIFAKDCYKK